MRWKSGMLPPPRPPSFSLLPLSLVIPLIKDGLVLSVYARVLNYRSWFWNWGEDNRGRLVVFKTCVWPGKPGKALWGHPLLLYKLRAMPAGAKAEPNERACWPVTLGEPLRRSPCNPGEATIDIWGSNSSSSSSKAAGDSWVFQHPSCTN